MSQRKRSGAARASAALLLLLATAILLGGCGSAAGFMDDPPSDRCLERALAAIEAGDRDAFTALFDPQKMDVQSLDEGVSKIFDAYRGKLSGYEKIGRYAHAKDALRYAECTYRVTTDEDTYFATLFRADDGSEDPKLYGFYLITEAEHAAAQPSGTLDDIGRWDAAQWGMLAWTALSYLFMALTLIHCVRHRMRGKLAFALLILTQLSLMLEIGASSIRFSFDMFVLTWSFLLRYPDGTRQLQILLPLGAALYWCIPKKPPLPKPAAEELAQGDAAASSGDDPDGLE